MNNFQTSNNISDSARYARCIETSKRVRWDICEDVIRGRIFNTHQKYLPDGIFKAEHFGMLSAAEKRYMSQVQGRTYANMFGLVERFINAKILEVSRDHWLGDQTKLEALVRFSDEELKHQALFRCIETMIGQAMPAGYAFKPQPDPVAEAVLGKSTWAVLGLTLMIELFTQAHYRESIAEDPHLSPLFKDVFHFHWMEESQHAILDEIEWQKEDAKLTEVERDRAVDDLIDLAVAVDGILQMQAATDAEYFSVTCGRTLDPDEFSGVAAGILKAYRWQYIFSGAEHPQFVKILSGLVSEKQLERIAGALGTLA